MIESLYKPFRKWSERGTVWLYSDPHFGDEELHAGIKNRPSDDQLVQLINSKVGRNDTFICLGDVGNVDYISKIRGYKVLICGNHDVGASNYQRQFPRFSIPSGRLPCLEDVDKVQAQHPNWKIHAAYSVRDSEWIICADNRLFDEVYTGPLMISEKILLSHEPLFTDWVFNIHGHMHYDNREAIGRLNVCADLIDYTPVNFNQFIKSGRLKEITTLHKQTVIKAEAQSLYKKELLQ